MKRIPVNDLEEIAADVTRKALADYEIPDWVRHNIILGMAFDGDDRIFELYVPGERPEDAKVISAVRINSLTGDVVRVEIFDILKKKA
jgi:hypothetical protein